MTLCPLALSQQSNWVKGSAAAVDETHNCWRPTLQLHKPKTKSTVTCSSLCFEEMTWQPSTLAHQKGDSWISCLSNCFTFKAYISCKACNTQWRSFASVVNCQSSFHHLSQTWHPPQTSSSFSCIPVLNAPGQCSGLIYIITFRAFYGAQIST